MGSPCKRGHGGKLEDCDPVNDEDQQAINNNTIKILLTRLANNKVVSCNGSFPQASVRPTDHWVPTVEGKCKEGQTDQKIK